MKDFNATRYKLKNIATERVFDDEGWTLEDKQSHIPSLIRAVYESKQIRPKGEEHGIYRFADWLPVKRTLSGSCAPVTYRSRKLAERLGLKNLYITFNGYFPEIGARMTTCSFKETEAYSVCGRLNGKHKDKVLVVASAGNTARAFAKVCSDNHIPLLLSVPEENIDALWFEAPLDDCVKLISPRHGADYYDAIKLSDMALQSDKFFAEGGAKNVARRDGMATTVLSAVTHIGRIPDYYFQAVGSGTGAAQIFVLNVGQNLVICEGVDSSHHAVNNAEFIHQRLNERAHAVGGAGSVGNNGHVLGIFVLVYTHNKGWGLFVLCRSGDDNLLCAGFDVGGSLFGGGEDTGRFNDILCAALFPRNFARVLAAVNIDRVAVYYKLAVLGLQGAFELAMHGVIFGHIYHVIKIDKRIVDADDLINFRLSHRCAEN